MKKKLDVSVLETVADADVNPIRRAYAVSAEKLDKGVKRELQRIPGGWVKVRRRASADYFACVERKFSANADRFKELKDAGRDDEYKALDRMLMAEILVETVIVGLGYGDVTLSDQELIQMLADAEMSDLVVEITNYANDFETFRKYTVENVKK